MNRNRNKCEYYIKNKNEVGKLLQSICPCKSIDIILELELSNGELLELLRDFLLSNHFRSIRIWRR